MSQPSPPIVAVVWDGASYVVVERLLAEGKLPNLQRVVGAGYFGPLRPPFPNCQTPVALASILTGSDARVHGISGYELPYGVPTADAASTVDHHVWKHSIKAFAVKPWCPTLWDVAAKSGRKVVFSHLPWAIRCASSVTGFNGYRGRGVTQVGALSPCEPTTQISTPNGPLQLSLDDGLKSVRVALRDNRRTLSIVVDGAPRWQHSRLADGLVLSACAWLTGESVRVACIVADAGPADTEPAPLGAPVVEKALGKAYRSGYLGERFTPVRSAESLFLGSLKLQARSFARDAVAALKHEGADLYMSYLPVIDEAQHELFRWWAVGGDKSDDPRVQAAALVIEGAYRLADDMLGKLLQGMPPQSSVLVISDHGFDRLTRKFLVNQFFKKHGFLSAANEASASPPTAILHQCRSGVGFLAGLPMQKRQSFEQMRSLFKSLKDPATGRNPLACLLDTFTDRDVPLLRERLGDFFMVANEGYELGSEYLTSESMFCDTLKGGSHTSNNGSPTLMGIFALAKAGGSVLNRCVDIEAKDVFHYICSTLGCTVPDNCTGQVPYGL